MAAQVLHLATFKSSFRSITGISVTPLKFRFRMWMITRMTRGELLNYSSCTWHVTSACYNHSGLFTGDALDLKELADAQASILQPGVQRTPNDPQTLCAHPLSKPGKS